MKTIVPHLSAMVLGAGLLLAGCAQHPARPASATASHPHASPQSPAAASTRSETGESATRATRSGHHAGGAHAASATSVSTEPVALPDNTGIPACDNYLSSYVACHRAAGIYKPDQIQGRYEAMRTSLLRDSENPEIRPQLAARCNSLASQLRQALHGKSCEGGPASPSSDSGD